MKYNSNDQKRNLTGQIGMVNLFSIVSVYKRFFQKNTNIAINTLKYYNKQ